MRSWLLVFLLSISPVFSTVVTRDDETSKVIRVPFSKERAPGIKPIKRDNTKTALQKIDNKANGKQDFLFYANITLGTPGQNLRLHIDTGSSDIWVETPGSTICKEKGSCETGGKYDNISSTSYSYVPGLFNISYVDGQFATGDYAKDTLQIGGVGVEDVQFGIGFKGTSQEGIFGIGFESRQSGVARGDKQYPGLISQMVNQNLINSRAYSIWLNDLNAAAGEILFGGIDTGKFKAPLTTIPLSRRTGMDHATDFIISLRGISVSNANEDTQVLMNDSRIVPALLDTGASFTYLPKDVADQLSKLVGAEQRDEYKGPAVDCSKRSLQGTVNFDFMGTTIRVNVRDFIIDATDDPNKKVPCYFGIIGMGDGSVLTLGDTFLRSAYVVYDMDNEEVSIGQTIFNSTSTNIVEIGSGPSAVPSVTRPSHVVTVLATGSISNGVSFDASTTSASSGGTASPRSLFPKRNCTSTAVFSIQQPDVLNVVASALVCNANLPIPAPRLLPFRQQQPAHKRYLHGKFNIHERTNERNEALVPARTIHASIDQNRHHDVQYLTVRFPAAARPSVSAKSSAVKSCNGRKRTVDEKGISERWDADGIAIASDLLWEVTRNNSSYLVKRKKAGGIKLSRDPLNLRNIHSRKVRYCIAWITGGKDD
ncbi:Barrierpepsin [Orbilia brochopaga]|nr:Barrierpepsin [Drechslerella brochopaga]